MPIVHRTWLVVAIILFAGCTSDKPDATPTEDTPRTGISGVVVTPTIQPIPGATIMLEPGSHEATSDLFGRFRYLNMEPGTYSLHAWAAGHDPTNMTITVNAGQTTRPRVVLQPVQPPVPGRETFDFHGLVEASLGAADPHAEPAKNTTGLDACECVFQFESPRYLVAIVIEATWEDSVGSPTGTEYRWNLSLGNQSVTGKGAAPIRALVDQSTWTGPFPYPAMFTISLVPDENWPTSEQEYDLYVTVFTVEPPPEDWSFIDR